MIMKLKCIKMVMKSQSQKVDLYLVQATVFLGASPDCFVHDPVETQPDGLIEIKYVSLNSGETLRDALLRKHICKLEGQNITINRNHQHFFQVQQQMFCSKKFWTDVVVKDGVEIHIERVKLMRFSGKMYYLNLNVFLITSCCLSLLILGLSMDFVGHEI